MPASELTCPPPRNYYIETGNLCNLRCPFCPTGLRRRGTARGFLSWENYQVILEKISPHANNIGLFNYGEPFLNRDILRMVAAASAKGIYTSLHSNLTFRALSPKDAEAVVATGLSCLSASMDGASQATYGKYRVGGSFSRALANLSRLQQAKLRLRAKTPEIIWGFLVNRFNEHEQALAQKMASDLGVTLRFSLMDVWGREDWKSGLHRAQENRNADGPAASGPQAPPPSSPGAIRLHPRLPEWCCQPFTSMIIHWNGEVFPCCTVYEDKFSLGNILKLDLPELWNGPAYRQCREFLLHYGPKQATGAVCETLVCAVADKFLPAGGDQ